MARYRQIHVKIWKDGWFLDLPPKHKLFFIYLFSNERASIAGIYELPVAVMAFESGLSRDDVVEAFDEFSAAGKAYYEDGVVWVANLRDYHETSSAQLQKGIQNEIDEVKDCALKRRYLEHYVVNDEERDPDEVAGEDVSEPPFEDNGHSREGINRVSRPSITSMSHSKNKSKEVGGKGGSGEKGGAPKVSDRELLAFLDANKIPHPETDRQLTQLKHPAVWAWMDVTRRWPCYDKLPAIARRLGESPNKKRLKLAWEDWVASDYNKGNVTGVLDFYEKRAPSDAAANGTGANDEQFEQMRRSIEETGVA